MGRGAEVSKLELLDEYQEQFVSEKDLQIRDYPDISLHRFEDAWLVILDVPHEFTLDELNLAISSKLKEYTDKYGSHITHIESIRKLDNEEYQLSRTGIFNIKFKFKI